MLRPVIRNFVLCDDVMTDAHNPRRVSLIGLLSAIRPTETPAYPLLYRQICAFAQLTECRGAANLNVQVYHADSGNLIFETNTYQRKFGHDPLEVHGVVFRIRSLEFSKPGLYSFEFCYNDIVEDISSLVLR